MNEATNNVNDIVEYEITSETTCEVVKVEGELAEVTIPEAVIIEGIQYAVTSVADRAFYGCKELESVEFPDSVEDIGGFVFWDCENLRKVKLPAGLTKVNSCMFKGCKSLEQMELPDSVTMIGDWAFLNCEKLRAIDLPSGLKTLKGGAFQGCASLKHIELPSGLTEMESGVFLNCPLLEELPEAPFCKYGFSEDVSKEVVDEEEGSTEPEDCCEQEETRGIKPCKLAKNIIRVWSYKGEPVKLFLDKIVIGEKELPTEYNKYTCKNGVLSCEDDENFYVYDGNQFVRTECKYNHHNDYFSPEVFVSAKVDQENSIQYIALNDHGAQYEFEYTFANPYSNFWKLMKNLPFGDAAGGQTGNAFSECHYFPNAGVLLLLDAFQSKLRFFSKTGEELWSLEQVQGNGSYQSLSFYVNTMSIDFESDEILIKVQKGKRCYTVCYNVRNGEVIWYRKENHPFLFSGAKGEDGLLHGLIPYKDNGTLGTVLFEMNPLTRKVRTYRISEDAKAEKVSVSGYETKNDVYKYILDGEILYAVHESELIVVDIKKKRILGRKAAPKNCKYFQNATVLIEDKLYVCLYYASGKKEGQYFSECYCLTERRNENDDK